MTLEKQWGSARDSKRNLFQVGEGVSTAGLQEEGRDKSESSRTTGKRRGFRRNNAARGGAKQPVSDLEFAERIRVRVSPRKLKVHTPIYVYAV